jgi:hypothetical protein
MTTDTAERQTSLPIAGAPAEAGVPVRLHDVLDLAVRATAGRITREDIDLLKATICPKFTDAQLALYVRVCDLKKVDPFSQAYGFPNEDGGLAFGLRIDGMRALAMRTGEYLSRTVETLLVPEGEKVGQLLGARATVQRKGMAAPIVEEAFMAEYYRKGHGWEQYPETMIRKVAESKALRAAFPDALSGVYEPAEMEHE